jgi:F-type H+-transporting ATPase subunit alpha
MFGSELDRASQAQLDRGYRLTELLKQPLNSPVPVEEQVIAIYAGTNGFIDDIPISDVRRFESELLDFVKSKHGALLDEIRTTRQLPDKEKINSAIDEFQKLFSPSESTSG